MCQLIYLVLSVICNYKPKYSILVLQFFPYYGSLRRLSWLNMVERFFGKITEEQIRRGVFKSVLELIEAIHSYVETQNRNPKPFVWTKTAEEMIAKPNVYRVANKTPY